MPLRLAISRIVLPKVRSVLTGAGLMNRPPLWWCGKHRLVVRRLARVIIAVIATIWMIVSAPTVRAVFFCGGCIWCCTGTSFDRMNLEIGAIL